MKNSVKPIALQLVDSSTISAASWTAFDLGGIEGACFFIRFNNDSTKDVEISYDGITAHDFIHSYTDFSINFQSNSSPNNQVSKLAKGTKIYISGTAGTGNVYLSGFYNE